MNGKPGRGQGNAANVDTSPTMDPTPYLLNKTNMFFSENDILLANLFFVDTLPHKFSWPNENVEEST